MLSFRVVTPRKLTAGLRGWLSAVLILFLGLAARAQTLPTDPQTPMTGSPPFGLALPEFSTWFQSGSPSLNGVVTPANSLNSLSPNFDFYKWSERMFLWLTSPSPTLYGGNGRIFDSSVFFDVSPPGSDGSRALSPHVDNFTRVLGIRSAQFGPQELPVLFDTQGRMLEIIKGTNGPGSTNALPMRIRSLSGELTRVSRVRIENGRKVFLDESSRVIQTPTAPRRISRELSPILRQPIAPILARRFLINGIPIFLDADGNVIDVEQGQADDSVLVAQNGSLVYFFTAVNDVFAYFLTGVKDNLISATEFPTRQTDLDDIVAFAQGPAAVAAGRSKTFVDPTALAVEVKSSWVEASTLPNPSDYITMTAVIPTYDKTDPTKWVPNGQKSAQLALVGMHVVGSVSGHTEMVWATFEHVGNTPLDTYTYINSMGSPPTSISLDTSGSWLFCASGSQGPFNISRNALDGSGDIVFNAEPAAQQAFPSGTVGPSDTIRHHAWGAATDAPPNPLSDTAASDAEIIAINNSVRSMLTSGDVRGNYIFKGATWTFGGAPTPGNQVGTSQLANSTMETYDQGPDNTTSGGQKFNCFQCHQGDGMGISHSFPFLKPLF
jgi:hypothetical protein